MKLEAMRNSGCIEMRDARTLAYKAKDLIVTDPPYNIGYKYAGDFNDNQSSEDYAELFIPMRGHRVVMIHYAENIMADIVPVLGAPQRCAAWTYPSNAGNRHWRTIAWWNCEPEWSRVGVEYKNPHDKRVAKLIMQGKKRSCPDHWEFNLVKNVSREKVQGYTNQIPEVVISRILALTANEGDVIVDPFCGTGTTAKVAEVHGYQWRTYDINERAIELATNRIEEEKRQTLF